jgi:hypothetical protein
MILRRFDFEGEAFFELRAIQGVIVRTRLGAVSAAQSGLNTAEKS